MTFGFCACSLERQGERRKAIERERYIYIYIEIEIERARVCKRNTATTPLDRAATPHFLDWTHLLTQQWDVDCPEFRALKSK